MLDPYRMVAINLFLLVSLCLILFIYNKILKKKINYPILTIIFSILPTISIFRKGVYESGDFSLHIYRSIDFYNSLKEGIIFPSWAANLNGGFGYPLFIFNYTLPYYPISLFHELGFSFIASMKIFLILSFILSGITMYFASKSITKSSKGAFSASIIYLYFPYHLIDLHFRVAIGEVMAFTLLPLLFYFVHKMSLETRKINIVLFGIFFSLCFLAHQATTIFTLIPLVIFALFSFSLNKINFKLKLVNFTSGIFLGIILSFYSWYPHFWLTVHTNAHLLSKSIVDFVNIKELLFSPWRLGFLFQGPGGELSFLIGYTQIFILIFAIYKLIKNKKKNKELLIWTACCLLIIFLMTPQSYLFWKYNPLLNFAQFSYRFLLPLSLSISFLSGIIISKHIKSNFIFTVIIFLTVSSTILNWGNRRTIPEIDDRSLFQNQSLSTSTGEGLIEASSKWWTGENLWITPISNKNIEPLNEGVEINESFRSTTSHEYLIKSKDVSTIRENTQYFPGWKAYVNNSEVKIDYQNASSPGKILIEVPRGLTFLEIKYEDVNELKLLKQISAIGYLLCLGFILINLVKIILKKLN